MKSFKVLFSLCLLALLVGCGESLPKNPPLTDEEPIILIRVQPAGIPSQKNVMKEFESLLTYFTDKDNKEALEKFRENIEEGDTGRLLTALFDLVQNLKKSNVKNFFVVAEEDCIPSGDRRTHDPFVAFDVHGLSKSQIKSAQKAVDGFNEDAQTSGNREIAIYNEGGYLVTNYLNSKYSEEENDFLEEKLADDMIEKWPVNLRKGLAEYQNCAISAVGKIPSSFCKELQRELDSFDSYYPDGSAQNYIKAARKSLKGLKNVNYYAVGVDFMNKTVLVSFFMESKEDAEDVKENFSKFLTELVKLVSKDTNLDVNKKDIEKLVCDIQVSQAGSVVTYSFSEKWLKDQKPFIEKCRPKDSWMAARKMGTLYEVAVSVGPAVPETAPAWEEAPVAEVVVPEGE